MDIISLTLPMLLIPHPLLLHNTPTVYRVPIVVIMSCSNTNVYQRCVNPLHAAARTWTARSLEVDDDLNVVHHRQPLAELGRKLFDEPAPVFLSDLHFETVQNLLQHLV